MSLWISGDTVLYDGVRQVADRLEVDIAVLHLGGVRFGRHRSGAVQMTAHEASSCAGSCARARHPGALRGVVALLGGARRDRAGARRCTGGHP